MEVEPTPDQQAFIRDAIASGRLHRPEKAAQQAFSLWEERERRRAEILAAVDLAEASLARGEGRIITEESMRQLAEDVKHRGRARLAAEQQQKPHRKWHPDAPPVPIPTLMKSGITLSKKAAALSGPTAS